MAAKDIQVILHNANNMPEDRYVNTLYYDVGVGGASAESIADGIAAAYRTHLVDFMGGQISRMTLKVYPPGRNPGGPELEKDYSFNPEAPPGPAEVALCLSYYAEFNQARRRGRLYLGPFAQGHMSERPGLNTPVGNFARALADVGDLNVANWLQHSSTNGSYNAVTNWFIDNAWDTQRRRGAKPTARSTGTV